MTPVRTPESPPNVLSGWVRPKIALPMWVPVNRVSKTGATTLPEQVTGVSAVIWAGATSGPRVNRIEQPELVSPRLMAANTEM